jgi:hypothetical protein
MDILAYHYEDLRVKLLSRRPAGSAVPAHDQVVGIWEERD